MKANVTNVLSIRIAPQVTIVRVVENVRHRAQPIQTVMAIVKKHATSTQVCASNVSTTPTVQAITHSAATITSALNVSRAQIVLGAPPIAKIRTVACNASPTPIATVLPQFAKAIAVLNVTTTVIAPTINPNAAVKSARQNNRARWDVLQYALTIIPNALTAIGIDRARRAKMATG